MPPTGFRKNDRQALLESAEVENEDSITYWFQSMQGATERRGSAGATRGTELLKASQRTVAEDR